MQNLLEVLVILIVVSCGVLGILQIQHIALQMERSSLEEGIQTAASFREEGGLGDANK